MPLHLERISWMPSPPLAPDDGAIDIEHLHRMTLGDAGLEREVLAMFSAQRRVKEIDPLVLTQSGVANCQLLFANCYSKSNLPISRGPWFNIHDERHLHWQ